MGARRIKGKDVTIAIATADGKKLGPFQAGAWDFDEVPRRETSDVEFANKLEKEFMMEDYEDEAKRRDVSLEELFALVIREALEPME